MLTAQHPVFALPWRALLLSDFGNPRRKNEKRVLFVVFRNSESRERRAFFFGSTPSNMSGPVFSCIPAATALYLTMTVSNNIPEIGFGATPIKKYRNHIQHRFFGSDPRPNTARVEPPISTNNFTSRELLYCLLLSKSP